MIHRRRRTRSARASRAGRLAPCGYGVERAAREPVPRGLGCPVVAVDGSAYYAPPAPRLADGARQLAHLLHPEAVGDPGLPARDVTHAGDSGVGSAVDADAVEIRVLGCLVEKQRTTPDVYPLS